MNELQGLDQGQEDKSAAPADGGEGTGAIDESKEPQAEGQSASDPLEKEALSPELEAQRKELLRAFHAKTQALAEERKTIGAEAERYKSDAKVLYDLGQEEWFKKAVADEKARRSGVSKEISDEDFEAIKSDKKSFQQYLQNHSKSVIESLKSEFKGEFEKLSKNQKELVAEREFEAVAEEYGKDFTEANEAKALDPYLDKGLSYEDAFLLHMQKQGKLAKKPDASSRQSVAVEKGGIPKARGGPIFKEKNLDAALERAFDLARKGTKDFRLERT